MRRCLIVANQTLAGPAPHRRRSVLASPRAYEFHILVPASHVPHGMWTEGHALAHARRSLARRSTTSATPAFRRRARSATRNPVLAVGDVLRREHFDEIILSTLPPGVSRWLKRDLPHRFEQRFASR